MIAIAIPVILVAVVAAGALAARTLVRQRRIGVREAQARRLVLQYTVPAGYAPMAVVLGLDEAGFEAVLDPSVPQSHALLIGGRRDQPVNREAIRDVLARMVPAPPLSNAGHPAPVRFLDEEETFHV